MFQKVPSRSMVIKGHISLSLVDGVDNKFQVENLRDLTLVLMMKLFSAKKELS
mgnify:CR=1 FL=1